MKKTTAFVLALVMCLSLFACGKSGGGDATDNSDAPVNAAAYPKEAGYFDPGFDYTQFKKFKVKYLI
ncbi:MAG: hypothetical protein LBC21_01705, partial [Oscillospiraceae bacterium]|nr:hypothetical protein [Oscillospiraceae bacterium]